MKSYGYVGDFDFSGKKTVYLQGPFQNWNFLTATMFDWLKKEC